MLAELPPEEMRIHLIDVGQGDAIWIQTPYFSSRELETRNILIDAGSCGGFGECVGGETVKTYLSNNGIVEGETLHALVLTHAHEDHYGGARTVAEWLAVEEYVVEEVLVQEMDEDNAVDAADALAGNGTEE